MNLSHLTSIQKKLTPLRYSFWKSLFWFTASVALVTMPVLSLDFGITWDEWIQSQYGKLVLKFLLTWGQDQSALSFGKNMYLYGGLFDALTAAIYGLLFDSVKHVANYPLVADLMLPHWHDVRHIVNSLFGFTAILFTGLAAQRIGGWRTGVWAMLFLLLSPRFFGNSMNNPKDIPFAAAAAIFTYFLLKLLEEIPRLNWVTAAGTAFGIALAINIKIGGILFLLYLWLFVGLIWLKPLQDNSGTFSFSRLLRILLPVSVSGYFAGLLFWPYGLLNPLAHPLHALGAFSKFSDGAGTLLFDGILYEHGVTPWHYLFKWILISSPLFFVAAILIFAFTAKILFSKFKPLFLGLLLFCAFFPILYAIAGKSVVYDSWRHFLFVYPPLVILAALTWDALIDCAKTHLTKSIILIVLSLLLAEPLVWMTRNHPNEYVYFNSLVGGLRGAYGKYETDYWGNCLRRASEGFIENYKQTHAPAPIVIRADGEPVSTIPYLAKGLGPFYVPFRQGQNEWNYSIEFSRGIDPRMLLNKTWPGPRAVYVVSADQVPLCAVIEK